MTIDTHKPYLAVYPWPVGFDQPNSPSYIPTEQLVQSCHGIGKSYHMWRNIRNWAAITTVGVTALSLKVEGRKSHLLAIGGAGGVGLIAGVYTLIRDRQYHKCVDDVANEVQRRHEAEVATNGRSAFWTTTPFQVIGAMQTLGHGIESVGRHFVDEVKPMGTQVVGVAAFVGLAIGAAYQLRFGNTTPLQRLVESF